MPLTVFGCGSLRRFQRGRGDVDDVVELAADFALGFDALGPVHDHAVARAAEVAGDLLGPLERRVAGPGPADREVREGGRIAPCRRCAPSSGRLCRRCR